MTCSRHTVCQFQSLDSGPGSPEFKSLVFASHVLEISSLGLALPGLPQCPGRWGFLKKAACAAVVLRTPLIQNLTSFLRAAPPRQPIPVMLVLARALTMCQWTWAVSADCDDAPVLLILRPLVSSAAHGLELGLDGPRPLPALSLQESHIHTHMCPPPFSAQVVSCHGHQAKTQHPFPSAGRCVWRLQSQRDLKV